MKRVFVDTDVIIDFLTRRQPFTVDAMKIIEYGHRKKLEINISSLCLNNVHYLISRVENKSKALEKVKGIMKLTEVLSVHKSTTEKAAYSKFKDYEDAVQNFCAVENGIPIIITRNVKDYTASELSVQTPQEFITSFEKNND